MTATPTSSVIDPSVSSEGGSAIQVALLGTRTSPPDAVKRLAESAGWCVTEHIDMVTTEDRPAAFRRFDVAVLVDKGVGRGSRAEPRPPEHDRQLELLRHFGIGALVFTSRPWLYAGFSAGTVCLDPDSPLDLVHGVLLALSRTRPVLRQIDKQLTNLNRLSETLRKQFEATDQELRLASRLQRDFLPRGLPEKGPIRFSTIFRPCTWVSGDIFDIFRLDERHWGFYIADAVGHGVAAGLLTMYIKHAIRTKRVFENGYELVPPSSVIAMLNEQLASQDLQDAQFITCWYGMINTETLELKYSVAGHPPPMLIDPDEGVRELHADGCVLGLSDGESFSEESIVLRPGQRMLLYSDGLDDTLIQHRSPLPDMPALTPGISELLQLPPGQLISQLQERLDSEPGSLARPDDVTVVLLHVTDEAGS